MSSSPSDPTAPPSASGQDELAQRIRDLAAAHGMPLRRDGDLADLLAAIKLDDQVPALAFAVVADMLFCLLAANQHHQAGAEGLR